MQLPTIAVFNFTTNLSGRDVPAAIRAVNRQVLEDFRPVWGGGRALNLYNSAGDPADPTSLQNERVPADSKALPKVKGMTQLSRYRAAAGALFTTGG